MKSPSFDKLKKTIKLNKWLPALVTALVIAAIDIPFEVSLAALIYSGDLQPFLAAGIGAILMGALIFIFLTGLLSSFPSSISVPQDGTAVLIAFMASSLTTQLNGNASQETLFITVVMAIVITTTLTGLVFLGIGLFRMGDLMRFIPYPVMGGFIAGTGWLLLVGGMQVMTIEPFALYNLPNLFSPDVLVTWLPGLAFSAFLVLAQRRIKNVLVLPILILTGTLLFYLVMHLMGVSLAEGRENGLLLGGIPSQGLWRPIPLSLIPQVDWLAILNQAGNIVAVLVLSTVSLLLNASALEIAGNREIDINHELRVNAFSNLSAGLTGSPPGFTALSFSTLGIRMKSQSRWNALFLAGIFGLVLAFGGPILSNLPKMIVGSMLVFLGLGFLIEWLVDSIRRLPWIDYSVVVVILLSMILWNPLTAIGLGILLSAVLFLIEYSRINSILGIQAGNHRHSQVERTPAQHRCLDEQGKLIRVVELHGFIFFGTANRLYAHLRDQVRKVTEYKIRYIMIDFHRVTGLDISAIFSFTRLEQLAVEESIMLVFSAVSPQIRPRLARGLKSTDGGPTWRFAPDLDHGLEWIENQLLSECHLGANAQDLWTLERLSAFENLLLKGLSPFFQRLEVPLGIRLIEQGAPPTGLYFVSFGQVTAQIEQEDGRVIRLRTMEAGTIVGELGVYLGTPAAATVISSQPSVVYVLPIEQFQRIEVEKPEEAAALHKFIAQRIGERLLTTLETVRELS